MSKWEQFAIEDKLIQILKEAHTHAPNHHFGRPYLSAYQLAIEFDQRHPEIMRELGYKLGGVGNEAQVSLTQYLAQQLSLRLHQGKLVHVEGALLSDQHVKSMAFRNGDEEVHSSLAGFGIALSLFRYVD